MNTFSLKIYASNKVFYEGEAISLTLPTIDGEMGILANFSRAVKYNQVRGEKRKLHYDI